MKLTEQRKEIWEFIKKMNKKKQFPSQTEIAKKFGTSNENVRVKLVALEAMGLLKKKSITEKRKKEWTFKRTGYVIK